MEKCLSVRGAVRWGKLQCYSWSILQVQLKGRHPRQGCTWRMPFPCMWRSCVPRSSKHIRPQSWELERSSVNILGSRILAIVLQQACILLCLSSKDKVGRSCCQPWCCCLVGGEGHGPRRGAPPRTTALFANSLLLPQFSEADEVLQV